MRIGIVLANPPGYSETFFNSKIKGLQENGFTVHLFVQRANPEFTLCPVFVAPKVYNIPVLQLIATLWVYIKLLPYFGRVLRYYKLLRKKQTSFTTILKRMYLNAHLLKANVDWVHFGFATIAIGSEMVPKAIKAKMAVSLRGFDINVYPVKHPGSLNLVWQQADKIHSISKYLHQRAIELALSPDLPYQIITPAVNLEMFNSEKLNDNHEVQIVTIARLNWIKGLHTSIQAMSLLKERGINFTYSIIGDGSTRDTERYKYQVHELQLTDRVKFLGKLSHSETIKHLEKATLYVQPSLNEGFCNAILEAQAMGKLVIATNTGAIPENVIDGTTGWLVPPEDALAMANKIEEIVELDETSRSKVSTAAMNRVREKFSLEQQKDAFVNFYTTSQ